MAAEENSTYDNGEKSRNKERFDADSFWKDLISRFFYPMLQRALPELYADADRDKEPRFLDKEFRDILNTSNPELHTSPHYADFLIEVPMANGAVKWILLHAEIQGQGGNNDLSVRMHHYRCLIFAHHMQEPVALAVVTDKRPSSEMPYYANLIYGTETHYRYNRLVLEDLDDDDLTASDNPFDLVLYAAKCALRTKEELQKFHYLRRATELLAERGWSQSDKRDLLLFLERVTNLKDKALIAQYAEYQRQLEKEGKILEYVSIIEKQGIEQGLERGIEQGKHMEKLTLARKMLARRMTVDEIVELTELSRDEVRNLMN